MRCGEMRLLCPDKGREHQGEQAESNTLGKAGTDHTAVEIHLQSPLNAFQKLRSRLTAKKCSLIH